MSYTELYVFEDGIVCGGPEFRNAWGGAARIWSSLWDRYCKRSELDNWITGDIKRLWALVKDERLPFHQKAVLAFTFDNAITRKDNFAQMASHLRMFAKEFPVPTGYVDHIPAFADFFESCEGDAIALHATSVTEFWGIEWDEESQEEIPYDLSKGTKHFEVYEYLKELSEQTSG